MMQYEELSLLVKSNNKLLIFIVFIVLFDILHQLGFNVLTIMMLHDLKELLVK